MIPTVLLEMKIKDVFEIFRRLRNDNVKELRKKFEPYFAEFTSSGSAAIVAALKALGVEKGNEVILPAYMCEKCAKFLIENGYKLKFVEIDSETYNIDLSDLKKKISSKTKTIIATHMHGNLCNISKIREVSGKIPIIEDSAQSFDFNKPLGEFKVFSLGLGKPITGCGGGVLLTENKKLADNASKIIANFGKPMNNLKVFTNLISLCLVNFKLIYNLSYKYKIQQNKKLKQKYKKYSGESLPEFSNFQAAITLNQLSKISKYNELRKRNQEFLKEKLRNKKIISINNGSVLLRFPIQVKNVLDIENKLRKGGIVASKLYPDSLPVYFGKGNLCPIAQKVANETVCLPIHPMVKENEIQKIVTYVRRLAI